jgi:hypothetical protein
MIERRGDLFAQHDWIGIPTNGTVTHSKAGPKLVMGSGLAKEARDKWPGLDQFWGQHVRDHGNVPCEVPWLRLISVPTQHHFSERSDLGLIQRSALFLSHWAWEQKIELVYLPRLGCGLRWSEVKPLLEGILDDRFIILN